MIWLTWRQFRVQAIVVYAALAGLAVALAADRRSPGRRVPRQRGHLPRPDRLRPLRPNAVRRGRRGGVRRTGRDRRVLGSPDGRPRTGGRHPYPGLDAEHHPQPLARHQARGGLARRRRRGRGRRPGDDVVVPADRQRGQRRPWRQRQHLRPGQDRARDVRLARDRPDRLRRVRVRPWRRGRRSPPAYRARDGRHVGGLCPRLDRDAELGPAPSGRAGPGDDP